MFGDNVEAVEQRIVDWQSTLEARARGAADVATQLKDSRFSASVAGGMVVATVDQAGHLVDLTLHQRVRDWPSARIAKAVLVATAAAREAMTARVRDLLAEAGFEPSIRVERGRRARGRPSTRPRAGRSLRSTTCHVSRPSVRCCPAAPNGS